MSKAALAFFCLKLRKLCLQSRPSLRDGINTRQPAPQVEDLSWRNKDVTIIMSDKAEQQNPNGHHQITKYVEIILGNKVD